MNNVILFGPPGIGKSTTIGNLKLESIKAVDLEDVDGRQRYQFPNHQKDTVLGAADLDPKRVYPGDIKVLLWLPQTRYEARRSFRDAKFPAKRNQREHLMVEWLDNDWDVILNASDQGRLIRDIQKLLRGQQVVGLRKEELL